MEIFIVALEFFLGSCHRRCFDEVIGLFVAACTEAKTIQSSISEPALFNFGRTSIAKSRAVVGDRSHVTGARFPPLVAFQDPPYQTVSCATLRRSV